MVTTDCVLVDASAWAAEDEQGQGNWCYAAVTQAVRRTLLGEQRSQIEIAHDFYLTINSLGGPAVANIGGSRGNAITNYATGLGLAPGADPVPYSHVQQWADNGQIVDPRHHLADAWGDVELSGLQQTTIRGVVADEDTETRICHTLEAGGLAVVGTALHCLLIHGYQLDTDDEMENVLARRFHQWDPTDGSTRVIDLADHTGQEITLVTV